LDKFIPPSVEEPSTQPEAEAEEPEQEKEKEEEILDQPDPFGPPE
ncbi:MAG: signal recognition particle-docking protein FtsY, partial [Opitutae bacterium]|nr:signal recognition particle-docking protein FtsY [Opitutae bacterium]